LQALESIGCGGRRTLLGIRGVAGAPDGASKETARANGTMPHRRSVRIEAPSGGQGRCELVYERPAILTQQRECGVG
jgi:hypothetical protein